MLKRLWLTVGGGALLFACSIAMSQEKPAVSSHGIGGPTAPASLCDLELKAAVSAVQMRNAGQAEEKLASALPPRGESNNALTVAMYSILDDVYSNPSIQTFPYYTYRMLTCMAKIQGKPVPPNFTTVAPAVLACQKRFGEVPSDPLINCIRTETFRDSHG